MGKTKIIIIIIIIKDKENKFQSWDLWLISSWLI